MTATRAYMGMISMIQAKSLLSQPAMRISTMVPDLFVMASHVSLMPGGELCLHPCPDQENPRLLIMGSRGPGSLKGAVRGSVSQKVAQHSACPVMIVK
ncbi:MAG: UspA domain-containing protein [Methanomicrobiales archaeon 53_19]|jgi:hypothetical protein|uniref:universal stress protein n=1 Tax=Methanocalculus sp. TaxID=2004547 RepID=UPI00074A95F6|nr:universal stress protein [Methanocalculus sp.]KUK69452.1 MAG: UspA domain-containing protein [Methanocalculus sp. 52_23]KUL05079.1 MAG: UspA domain-containing protein [Methanomicrobiales archaeon 53_19]